MQPHSPPERRYEVQNQIAAGGMGVVYRVRDRVTGELQALKRVTLTGDTHDARAYAIEAFEREYHVLASLDHPRIIRVFDYGVDAEGPYYTMELLEGQDMRRAAPLPVRTACQYLRDVATSLALLHNRRVLHRDLSPSNIRVTQDGHCKLFDFGALAAFGPSPHVVGTPPLVAPEMLDGSPLDQRADLYALGALAYWVLTGRHAYPVRHLNELPDAWATPLSPPSTHVSDLPAELDTLVLSLLNRDPLGRPGSAAEVIARLEVIGQLEPENSTQSALLAQSFFTRPRFTGRSQQLRVLGAALDATMTGHGAALRIESVPGMGRTRLLDEVAIRARLAGATVIAVDASMFRQLQGTAQALVQRVFELMPLVAHEHGVNFRQALTALGSRAERLVPAAQAGAGATRKFGSPHIDQPPRPLAEFFAEISTRRPLVITIDNVEDADDASHGLLASLSSLAERFALLIVLAEAHTRERSANLGADALHRHSQALELQGLSSTDMLELLRSIFADAPNLERFADFMHERAAGSPLHAFELCRSLFAKGVIRYERGLWTLPSERPSSELPAALGDALAVRLNALSKEARALAECLSLQRDQPSLALCKLLCADSAEPALRAREWVEELSRADVLQADRDGYRFSSAALRSALLQDLKEERLEANHRRLGSAFAQFAGESDLALRIEAGFHLIEGAEEQRGADMIADVARGSFQFRTLVANLFQAGRPVETALKVYRKHRRSKYERMPLLAALAQAGYYENRSYAEQYGDEALDLLEELSGLATSRRVQRFLGSALGLCFGIFVAYLRFVLTPRRQRPYKFREIFLQLFSSVTSLSGVAALSLDGERTTAIAKVLAPFAFLPERFTPVGIYQFCNGLTELVRENEVEAYARFELLLKRFSDPHYYRSLPPHARTTYLAGVHFARGTLAVFCAHGSATLDSANALEAMGLKLYGMIASQLRFLYYAARGEFVRAAPHRNQVELHAAHVGSVWQVETWEAAALILINAVAIGEVVSTTRIVHRLEALSRTFPSLKRYARLANSALIFVHRDLRYLDELQQKHGSGEVRSYIGWAATMSAVVRSYNHIGDFAAAKSCAESALAHVTEADRELVALFIPLDIQMAIAEAGLGDVDQALARLDRLLVRFADCDHPLLHGMLHETRAFICWEARRVPEYEHSRAQTERWFRPTGTPALIAKCERLAGLSNTTKTGHTNLAQRPSGPTGTETTQRGSVTRQAPPAASASQDLDTMATVSNGFRPHPHGQAS